MDIEKKVWEVLCSEQDINKRIKELGAQITADYKDKNLMVISLLRGSFIFCADLVRAIDLHTRIEFSTMQIDDNTIIDVLEIRKSYLFDTNNVM